MKEKVLQIRMELEMWSRLHGLAKKAGFTNTSEYMRFVIAKAIEKEQSKGE